MRPPIVSSVTPAKEVFTLASPFTLLAVTEPLLFSTIRFPLIRSARTLPKLVLAKVSPPMSVRLIAPFPVMARIPLGMFEASMAPKEDLRVTLPRASRTMIFPLEVSASRAPLMASSSMLPKESRIVTEPPVTEAVGNVGGAANTRNLHVSVVVVHRKIASNIACLNTPKRSRDGCGSSIRQNNRSVASCNCGGALNIPCGDAAKTISYLEGAFYVRHLHGSVVVAHGDISSGPSKFNAAKGVCPPAGAGVSNH